MGNCLVLQDSQMNNTEDLEVGQTATCTFSTIKHTVSASAKMVIEENAVGAEAVRIKLVLKKNQLKEMLRKELVSVDDIISLLNTKRSKRCENDKERRDWRPVLESIPEESQFF
ncbi:hypothetical protein LUZ61_003877 [Rhynchospora tenuis]|uniref:Uncharacterized protein n=1 Tax=Rhynchospora tenuis TaxID=198213 RepID=A0AAD5ZLM5_9POAL|nr:hypothetical protein LUZ61_003877 [Rhynchospora tenuis]